ncbi:MAG: signal peptidase [Cereibacter sphaeroides]|uniref:Signal peptidase n=1 Tax=Cereibacter sphaeroides TaxID=1063 RepID=A0A2W5USU7_CERSP|nr:MAG: signal peptidase [Cereibacter sphaeroides]
MLRAIALSLLLALPAKAGVKEILDTNIFPGYAAFSAASDTLAAQAQQTCDPVALRPAYNAAFDAWLGVQHLRMGPGEEDGRSIAIAFWPDPKALGQKATNKLIAAQDPVVNDPAAFAKVSVGTRGLFTLERLLYGDYSGDYVCALTRAVATDLARMANEIEDGWRNGYSQALLTAGQPGNTQFLSEQEALQAIYTQLMTGFEFTKDTRIGRPLGTFDRPRPERAEARLSGRSLRNVRLSLVALKSLAVALAPDSADAQDAIDRAIARADKLDDPIFAGVAEPQSRFRVEALQQAIGTARDTTTAEIGPALGVSVGFNSADGD